MSLYLNQYYYNSMNLENEPWPKDGILYQPDESKQILLPESASCLAVKTYLKMCNLPFEVRFCENAEFMSPGGRIIKLPFICAGNFLGAEFEKIVYFVESKKNLAIGQQLDDDEKLEMLICAAFVENTFSMAEIYISFVDERVYKEVTAPRNGCVFPWPLNRIQNYRKKRNYLRLLKVHQWHDMKFDDVIEKVKECCKMLTMKLEEKCGHYFYSDEPCQLDAIVFGHIFTILTNKLPNMALSQTVQEFKRLVEFCRLIDEKFFQTQML